MSDYRADFKQGGINPYHFVRLGDGVTRSEPAAGNLTGVIHCRLKTTRPLCIPDLPHQKNVMTNEPGKPPQPQHKQVPFFRVQSQPVIPGSELRGVIRSAYETLSNSCLSVNNNNELTERSSDVRQPGIIRYETQDQQWHLYEATSKKLAYDGSEDFDETPDTIKREWLNYRYVNKKPQYKDGKIRVTYKFTTVFHEVETENLETALEDYGKVCEYYKTNVKGIASYIHIPRRDGNSYPVYYLLTEEEGHKRVYLSPAQISRSVFHNRLDTLLSSYHHCVRTDELCEACRLFGMIAEQHDKKLPSAIASRVRFTDAVCVGDAQMNYYTLRELSSPKLSSVEFYSTAPDMKTLWTYDTPGAAVNGRKYYFHHSEPFQDRVRTNRNMTAELVETGTEFVFDIFYEHLTENELRKLIWTVTLGENDIGGKQQHKIGHGKPLGLGSVKMTVESVVRRTFDPVTLEYTETADTTDYCANVPFDMEAGYFRDFMHMTDFTFLRGNPVKYPYGDDCAGKPTSTGTLSWFKANHNDGQMVKPGDTCTMGYALPRLTDQPDNLILPALIRSGDRSGNAPRNTDKKNGGSPRGQKPMVYRSESRSTSIVQKEKVYCKATKKCKGVMEAVITPGFMKKEQELKCPVCGRITKGKW